MKGQDEAMTSSKDARVVACSMRLERTSLKAETQKTFILHYLCSMT